MPQAMCFMTKIIIMLSVDAACQSNLTKTSLGFFPRRILIEHQKQSTLPLPRQQLLYGMMTVYARHHAHRLCAFRVY
jgi:hypothetical protein